MNLFLDCVKGLPVKRPPVWFMRQAGRYLSEYRDTKSLWISILFILNPHFFVYILQTTIYIYIL